jgi:hypothetical protein
MLADPKCRVAVLRSKPMPDLPDALRDPAALPPRFTPIARQGS